MGSQKNGAGQSSSARSIAIIPDGNRRFARKNNLPLAVAYKQGFEKVSQVLEWAEEGGVKSMGFWALSLENFSKRSDLELGVLFRLMQDQVKQAFESSEFSDKGVSVRFFGRKSLLPKGLQELFAQLEQRTSRTAGLS